MTAIDHVIFGARDMDAVAARWWSEHGLASYEGGVHPQFGTGNRIVPLGDAYIEIMGVADHATARENPLGAFLLSSIEHGDRWLGWVVRTDDIEAAAKRIGSVVVPGRRERPDGGVVSWTLSGLEITLGEPALPFFIAWDDVAEHPGRVPLEHREPVAGVASIVVEADEARLSEHLGAHTLPVVVRPGDGGIRRVTLARASGELTLD